MMKNQIKNLLVVSLLFGALLPQTANAQLGGLLKKVKKTVTETVESTVKEEKQKVENNVNNKVQQLQDGVSNTVESSVRNASDAVKGVTSLGASSSRNTSSSSSGSVSSSSGSLGRNMSTNVGNGPKVYVSMNRGSARGAGTQDSPYRDLQKAIDNAEEGSVVCVAEGNYLGKLDCGYIEIKKYIKVVGGYSDNFSERNPLQHVTRIQPTKEQNGTNGSRGLFTIDVKGNPNGEVLIDGFLLDLGMQNNYQRADPSDPRCGCCEGCETGRITPGGEVNGLSHQLMKGNTEGRLIVRNCVFANGLYFGLQMTNLGGHWEIYNNVFISNVYAACSVSGAAAMGKPISASVDFHHNTVLFSWCRTKEMEDMGYGYRYMIGVHGDVHDNIFGCSNLGALDRTHIDSNKAHEADRKTSAYNNMFFMNAADLVLPSTGGKWTLVKAARFDEVDQMAKCEGNIEAPKNSNILKKIDPDYLKGFATLKVVSNTSFDANSAANLYRQVNGMNMQGTSTTRVSMYGNRYDADKALSLFGAESRYGAQLP